MLRQLVLDGLADGDVAANNLGLLMTVRRSIRVPRGCVDVLVPVERPVRCIEQVGVIMVSPTDQPGIALERIYEFDENQPVFCVLREHRIDLFEVV